LLSGLLALYQQLGTLRFHAALDTAWGVVCQSPSLPGAGANQPCTVPAPLPQGLALGSVVGRSEFPQQGTLVFETAGVPCAGCVFVYTAVVVLVTSGLAQLGHLQVMLLQAVNMPLKVHVVMLHGSSCTCAACQPGGVCLVNLAKQQHGKAWHVGTVVLVVKEEFQTLVWFAYKYM
jgi:hypothetical protein